MIILFPIRFLLVSHLGRKTTNKTVYMKSGIFFESSFIVDCVYVIEHDALSKCISITLMLSVIRSPLNNPIVGFLALLFVFFIQWPKWNPINVSIHKIKQWKWRRRKKTTIEIERCIHRKQQQPIFNDDNYINHKRKTMKIDYKVSSKKILMPRMNSTSYAWLTFPNNVNRSFLLHASLLGYLLVLRCSCFDSYSLVR